MTGGGRWDAAAAPSEVGARRRRDVIPPAEARSGPGLPERRAVGARMEDGMTTADRLPQPVAPRPRPGRRSATRIVVSEWVRALLLLALLVALVIVCWAAPAAVFAVGGGAFLAVLLSIPVNALA